MRSIVLVFLLAPTAALAAGALKVVSQTPASISFECIAPFLGGCEKTPQEVANVAQAHCKLHGRDAEQTYMGIAPSGDLKASFRCVR